jgi:hypothetical protein
MKSRLIRPTVLALLVLLLVAGSAPILAGAKAPQSRAATGFVDSVSFGTAWVPEVRGAFGNHWYYYGWGVQADVKPARAGTGQWVHIPITLLSYNEGTGLKVASVEFCAKSSNGNAVYPTDIHLWEEMANGTTRFLTQAITWPHDNAWHCVSADPADAWRQSLGISVRVYFGNETDTITLGKAWAHLVP